MESIIQKNKQCFLCDTTSNLHEHHIFNGTANRKKSEKYGLKVWLCVEHHTSGVDSVHMNKQQDLRLKRVGQVYYNRNYEKPFISVFGKSYLV